MSELDAGWQPSQELIEAVEAEIRAWSHDEVARRRDIARAGLSAAVAFRGVDGHPELVPYAEHQRILGELFAAQEREDRKDVGLTNATTAHLALRAEVAALVTAARTDLDGRHPLEYGFRDRHAVVGYDPDDETVVERMRRCPTCEEWSPCALRAALIPFTEHQEEK